MNTDVAQHIIQKQVEFKEQLKTKLVDTITHVRSSITNHLTQNQYMEIIAITMQALDNVYTLGLNGNVSVENITVDKLKAQVITCLSKLRGEGVLDTKGYDRIYKQFSEYLDTLYHMGMGQNHRIVEIERYKKIKQKVFEEREINRKNGELAQTAEFDGIFADHSGSDILTNKDTDFLFTFIEELLDELSYKKTTNKMQTEYFHS